MDHLEWPEFFKAVEENARALPCCEFNFVEERIRGRWRARQPEQMKNDGIETALRVRRFNDRIVADRVFFAPSSALDVADAKG